MRKSHFLAIGPVLVILLMAVTGGDKGWQKGQKTDSIAGPFSSIKVDANFGRMPLYFIPNKGQMDGPVAYYVQGKDKTVYFTDEGITFALAKARENDRALNYRRSARCPKDMDARELIKLHSREGIEGPYEDPVEREIESGLERWVVKLDFGNANPNAHPEGLEETGTKISYFRGKPEEWKAGLPAYSKVMYRNLWPGIDLIYYGTVNRLKYEFIVHPGADPAQIRLAYRGAESVLVAEDGRLQVKAPMGGFSDDVPVAYQEIDGNRIDIEMAYMIGPSEDANAKVVPFGFEVGKYDRNLPLVLDPAILIYCGYIGGNSSDTGSGIAVDSAGCAYITGYTLSSQHTFPVTVGPDLTFNGWIDEADAYVAKIDASGMALIYCGYIGGARYDTCSGIAVDGAGCVYVTGMTQSFENSFPVTVGPDLTYNGGYLDWDVFVAKVNQEGTALDYCGYIGGSKSDYGYGIAVDSSSCAYVTGGTWSSEDTFPVIVGPDLSHESHPVHGGTDAFVAKVNSLGTALIYCGYIGGSSVEERGVGIAVDSSGCAYVTGGTWSSEDTFPVAVGPDLIHNGVWDAFVAKVNPSGTALLYCGYIGGSGSEWADGIAVDIAGCAYVTGTTWSSEDTFPVTVGPDLVSNGGWDAFVAKVNAAGTSLDYCGYIGGLNRDYGYSIALDSAGCAYVTGVTGSSEATFPVTMGPDLSFNGGGSDAFVAKINAFGTALSYCGYVGGDRGSAEGEYESCRGIAVDKAGSVYLTGYTGSSEASFPARIGPDLSYNGGYIDAFVAKISPEYFGYNVFDGHDFNGDGCSDIAVWRPSDGFWYIRKFDNDRWGQVNDIPVPGDYDGDGFTDLAVWRPSDGYWYIRGIDNDRLGQVGDVPVPKDYDGDGRTDLAVWRPSDGTWHIRYRAGGGKTKPWGQTGDYPVPGDYDGDGLPDLAVWRPSNGLWYIKGVDTDRLGQDGDIPAPADYDGDGRTDLAVWRPTDGTWHIRYRAGGGKVKLWGMPGDVPVPGDYNGDAITDMAVWRPSTSQWLIRKIDTVRWGAPGDIPLVR